MGGFTDEVPVVTITVQHYPDLVGASFKLDCLEAGGVDNWEGYSESLHAGGYFDEVSEEDGA